MNSDQATKLVLYRDYIYYLEHLLVLCGSLPLKHIKYDSSLFQNNVRDGIFKIRNELHDKILAAEH